MTLVILTGPQAVGKMTVGQQLEKLTQLTLFHNHMTIDLVGEFFSYSSDEGRALVALFRREIFKAVAASDKPGLIFTYVWAFDLPEDRTYVEGLAKLFTDAGHPVYFVELEASFGTRLTRNPSPNRLAHKPSKRDLVASEADLRQSAQKYRLNSDPGELGGPNYLRIDNTNLAAEQVAQQIKSHFKL